jgi:serralysin
MATVDYSPADEGGYDNPYINTLIGGVRWENGPITYTFVDSDGQAWSPAERATFEQVLDLYREIALLDFEFVSTPAGANWDWYKVPVRPGDDGTAADHNFPGPNSRGRFGYDHEMWTQREVGAFGFFRRLARTRARARLAHPHDGGPYSSETFPGVSVPDDEDLSDNLGEDSLNQSIWTMMSYNFGWNVAPPLDDTAGHPGTPMALDIAALQELYGKNYATRSGATVYELPFGGTSATSTNSLILSANSSGAYWTAIWDGGGSDTISNEGGNTSSTIDLRAAPLSGANAGGYVSRLDDTPGGYTIANGVVIENAIGGYKDDVIIGNSADNLLEGGEGADSLTGGLGEDTATYARSSAGVKIDLAAGTAKDGEAEGDTFDGIERLIGSGEGDQLRGNGEKNWLFGRGGIDILDGRAGDDTLKGGLGDDVLIGGADNDALYGAESDLIQNGGFEGASSDLVFAVNGYSNDPALLGGWLSYSTGKVELFTKAPGDLAVGASEGRFGVDLEVPDADNIDLRQKIDRAEEGQRYRIAFDIRKANDAASAELEVRWGGSARDTFTATTTWRTVSIEVLGGAGSSNDGTRNLLQFWEKGALDGYGTLLDNVRMYRIGGIYGNGDDPFLDGSDAFFGGTGVDVAYGHGGDDSAKFDDMDADAFDGGAGTDLLIADWTSSTTRVVYRGYNDSNSTPIGVSESFYNFSGYLNFANVERFNLTGSNYDDELRGGDDNDVLNGGEGDDTFRPGLGVDVVDGGAGNDHVILKLAAMEYIDRAKAASEAGFKLSNNTHLISIESISIEAGDGDDTYDVRGTRTSGTGPSRFDGGGGEDTFMVDLANSVTSFFDGGPGIDRFVVDWSAATTSITFFSPIGRVDGHFQYGFRTGATPNNPTYFVDMIDVEQLEFTAGSGNDKLEGLVQGVLAVGSDRINPGRGRDEIDFKTGSDTLVLDWKHGERGIVYGTESLPYHLRHPSLHDANPSNRKPVKPTGDLETGYAGAFGFWSDTYSSGTTDRVDYKGVEHFHLTLGSGSDQIATGDGDDVIFGGGGRDWYATGKGLDSIVSGDVARWEADKSAASAMVIDLNEAEFTYQIGARTATISGIKVLGSSADARFKTGSGGDVITTTLNGTATANGSNDYIETGGGADTVTVRGGKDHVDLGSENDLLIVDYSGIWYESLTGTVPSGPVASGYAGLYQLGTATSVTYAGAERFDVRLGPSGNHNFRTGDGDDAISLGTGRSVIDMAAGADALRLDWSTASFRTVSSMSGSAQTGYSGVFETVSTGIPGNRLEYAGVERFELKLGSGDDDLINGGRADVLDGGGGIDMVRYAGTQSEYTITTTGSTASGGSTVQVSRAGVTDTLSNIEEIRFDDGSRTYGDVYGSGRTTRGVLQPGSPISSGIDSNLDQDWFTLSLTAGRAYVFALNAAPGSGLDPMISGIYGASGGPLPNTTNNNGGGGLNARLEFTPTTTGTYYLEAQSFNRASNGAYVLSATDTGPALTAGSISINDVSITEGNSGTKLATFTVTRSGGTAAFDVDFATANGTAAAGGDYAPASGTLNFAPSENTKTISVVVSGDRAVESPETFVVNLSGATNGAVLSDGQGLGRILNDDARMSDFGGDGTSDVLCRMLEQVIASSGS